MAPPRFLVSATAFLCQRPGGWYAVATGLLTVVAAVATLSLGWTSTRADVTTFVASENAWRYRVVSLDGDGVQSTSLTSIWAYVLLGTLAATLAGVVLWLTRCPAVGAVVTLAATAATAAFALVNIRYPYFAPSLADSGTFRIYDHGPGGWITSITAAEATVAALAGACRVLADRRRPTPAGQSDGDDAAAPAPEGAVPGSEPERAAVEPSTSASVATGSAAERHGMELAAIRHTDQLSVAAPWAEDVLDGVPGSRLAGWTHACRHRVGSAMASIHGLGIAVVGLSATGIASLWLSWLTQRNGAGPTDSLSGFQFWYGSWSASYATETLWITLLGLLVGVTLLLAVRWILLPDPVIVTATLVAATCAAAVAVVDLVVLNDTIRSEQGRLEPDVHLSVGLGPWLAVMTTLLAVCCAVRGTRQARRARVWAFALAPDKA